MEFYRLGPDALSTFFRPKTRGQRAVLRYIRGEVEALREILQERDRAARLAISAPQVTGTSATHRWLRDPGPQSVAELLAERDAAASNLREDTRNFSWPWRKQASASGSGPAPGSPRTSGETQAKSDIKLGKCQGHMSTCGMSEGCNIGRPPPPTTQNLRARILQVAREREDERNQTSTSRWPSWRAGNGESSTSVEPRWPFSSSLTDDESDDEDDSSIDSDDGQEFMDRVYDLQQKSACFVAEKVSFQKARMVDTDDQETASINSSEKSNYDNEQQDDYSDDDYVPLCRYPSRGQNSAAYKPWSSLYVPPGSPPLDSPPGGPMPGTASHRLSRDIYFDEPDSGRRLVPRLYCLAAFYPFYSADGMARVRELYALCGCPPHYKPVDVILALLRCKPETRAFMARKVPGVARRANQINWMNADYEISNDEDSRLFWEWEQSGEPLFKMEDEERRQLGEAPDSDEVVRPREVASRVPRHLAWKPVKSKLSEEASV
ncbi:hypothetical protein UCRPA7_7220 [Phaeoacremonium minimum UCRPA7]|uniref:Uncharacterized protein n=1 Tax=Phaeoacremonium minimum (strain UCR-PA7) TaxID=1286976 RepID=R8BDD1_PHAM7|nr:hypothetical protein UCRPA7_7220 [Phaeoacremonium minimum UCRPA7]EON97305.1 hypothetical protein UCRPA7_7220 [Phaeoacremonium minimum UCRPA7]